MTLGLIDGSVACVYLALIAVLTVRISCWQRGRATTDSAHKFFLAEQAAPWYAVCGSYFASNIGSDAIIGLSSAGATVGMAAAFFDISSALAFILLAYCFLPVYRRSGVMTLPEYIGMRFGEATRSYLALVALILYALNKTAVALLCGSILLEAIMDVNGTAAVFGLLALTSLFTLGGGLAAVIAVEMVNTVLLLAGGFAGLFIVLSHVGWWAGLRSSVESGSPAAVAAGLTPSFMHLYQPSASTFSFPALALGAPFSILWYHCADQEMVQRGLSARSGPDSRLGSILGGFLKLTVPWTWAVPGVAARLLFPAELGCSSTPGEPCQQANRAFPILMLKLMPPGVVGVLLAASIAGVLSVLASTFNSASTLFAMDVYRRLRPHAASPDALVAAGRVWIVAMTVIAVLWLPFLGSLSPSLYVAMQTLNSLLAPPIVVVFIAAIAWPGATSVGVLSCLIVGHSGAVLWLALQHSLTGPMADYLFFSAASAALSGAVMVGVSLCTQGSAPPVEQVAHLMSKRAIWWWGRFAAARHSLHQQCAAYWHPSGGELAFEELGEAEETSVQSEYAAAGQRLEAWQLRCDECGKMQRDVATGELLAVTGSHVQHVQQQQVPCDSGAGVGVSATGSAALPVQSAGSETSEGAGAGAAAAAITLGQTAPLTGGSGAPSSGQGSGSACKSHCEECASTLERYAQLDAAALPLAGLLVVAVAASFAAVW